MSDILFAYEDPEQQKFIQIDEDGRFMLDGVRTTDESYGRHLLENLIRDDKNRILVESNNVWAMVEAFDEPYVVEMISIDTDGRWQLQMPYGLQKPLIPESLCVDEWDRFHGHCDNGISFVMSRKAQAAFFDLVDEFDDDSVTINGQKIDVQPWLLDNSEALDENFWTHIYNTEPSPPFDLGEPAKALSDISSQLKLNKCRIAVLGAGKGHDAAFFAEQGHLVTAFDISEAAIEETNKRYGNLKNLKTQKMDVLQPSKEFLGQFDLVFEHTCYCAIPPSRRNDLVQAWRKLLTDGGHVLGVFFAMDKRFGPPYGGSEWELRQRFKKHFDFTYWTRWHHSLPRRVGKEVVIYMQKKSDSSL